jgi:hypothetical protein
MVRNDVDHGGLVTTEQHSHSAIRLVYPIRSMKRVNRRSSQILAGFFRLENQSFKTAYT